MAWLKKQTTIPTSIMLQWVYFFDLTQFVFREEHNTITYIMRDNTEIFFLDLGFDWRIPYEYYGSSSSSTRDFVTAIVPIPIQTPTATTTATATTTTTSYCLVTATDSIPLWCVSDPVFFRVYLKRARTS